METTDTGLSDNFGIQDGLRILDVLQKWIAESTGGVVMMTIRDSEKSTEILPMLLSRIFKRVFAPFKSIFANWDNIQII